MIGRWISLIVLSLPLACYADDGTGPDGKVGLLEGAWMGKAIAYSGYREGQDPRQNIYPSLEEVTEDLKLLAAHWNLIRTYGADQHARDVLEVIRREHLGLKVMLGIWLDGEPEYIRDNEQQVKMGIRLANEFSEIVVAINVGNESQVSWSDHKVPRDKLIAYIRHVQEKTAVPVTTADTWDYWVGLQQSQPLVDAVDFIATHIYPIWGRVGIDRGMEATIENYGEMKKAIPNKTIIITEAGWATYTEGNDHAPGAGSEENQVIYYKQLMDWSEENNILIFWFEAFDEPWKGTGTEGFWGLYREDRTPKKAMQDTASEQEASE